MKAELLYNPGNTVCDYLKIKNDHKFILRLFINLVYYGHVIGAVILFSCKIKYKFVTKKYLSLFIITIITLGCSYASALVTRKSNDTWYQSLTKASLSPPDWVFAPVWITLYILMSIAVWKVYDKLKYIKIRMLKNN